MGEKTTQNRFVGFATRVTTPIFLQHFYPNQDTIFAGFMEASLNC